MVVILVFMVGEGFNASKIKISEWALFLFFPFGICFGMILAWWKESTGGIVTVGSVAMFYLIHYLNTGGYPRGWAFLVFTIPGFLFLLYSYQAKRVGKAAAQR